MTVRNHHIRSAVKVIPQCITAQSVTHEGCPFYRSIAAFSVSSCSRCAGATSKATPNSFLTVEAVLKAHRKHAVLYSLTSRKGEVGVGQST